MIWATTAFAVTLDEAWQAASEVPELRAAAAGAERAQATVGAARAALLPKVLVNGKYTWNDQEVTLDLGEFLPPEMLALTGPIDPFVVQQQDWFEASATVVQPLIDVDAWRTLAAARSAAGAADADLRSSERQIRLGVARAFYGAAMAREGVRVAGEAVVVATRQEEIARARVAAGDAAPLVVLEAEQARLGAERDRLAAVEQQARAEEALHRVTGLARDVPLEVVGPTPEPLVGARPELAAAEGRAEAAKAALSASRLGWAPDVNARVTGLWTENQGFAPDQTFVVGVVEATWTFDGGYRSSRVRDAAAADVAARAMAEAVARQLEEERGTTAAALRRAEAASVAASRERDAAEERLKQAEAAFAQGLVPFHELERASLGRSAAAFAESRERLGAALAAVEVALVGL